jgi:MFS family permease
MSTPPETGRPATVGRATRWAAAAPFAVLGAVFAAFVVRIPSIKIEFGLSDGQLGLLLALPLLTAIAGMQVAGALAARFGSAAIVRATMVGMPLSLVGIGLSGDVLQLALALLLLGLVDGLADVSMNAHAVAVERAAGRPVMNFCHAGWSVGSLAGAATGGLFITAGAGLVGHFVPVAAVVVVLALVAGRFLLPASADAAPTGAAGRPRGWRARWRQWRAGWTPRLLLLGLTGTVLLITEVAVSDWSGIYLHEVQGASLGVAALGLVAFSVSQTGGRLVADRIQARVGAKPLVRASGAVAVAGLTVVVLSPAPAVAIAGYAIMGLGMATLIPILLSTVGHGGADSAGGSAADALSKVNTLTYSGLLAGPVVVGAGAEAFGLTETLVGMLVLFTLALIAWFRQA